MYAFICSLVAMLCWSGSDIFSKIGSEQKDKSSEWKVIFAVGVIMGLHAVITLIGGYCFNLENSADWVKSLFYTTFKPMDFVRYAPIAFVYLLAIVIGYVGLRYIELSVSSPICNSSGSLALVICLIFGLASFEGGTLEVVLSIVGVLLVTLGIVGLGVVEYHENDEARMLRQEKANRKYTKSFIAILIPILYLIIDALGTVGDQFIFEKELIDDYAANTAFELMSVCFAIFAFCWVKFKKKERFFTQEIETDENGEVTGRKGLSKFLWLGGLCETLGQIFYMSVMFSDFDAGMVIISCYCVVSVVWSRIFLKEKLSWAHYIVIAVAFIGIGLLGFASPV